MPKVSVIIPNYNHAKYLEQRIQSVLDQTFQDFELIILDDCSKDNSRDIIEQYKDNFKITNIIFNKENSGSTFKQWKKGISLAKGEWIWLAESDDYCNKDLLCSLVSNIERGDNVVLSYCQSYYQEEGIELVGDMSFHTDPLDLYHWKSDYCSNGLEEIKKYLLYKNTIPNASAVIFKKETYLKVDKAFEGMRLCGDWMLWVQLLKKGDVAFCAKPLNHFRTHNATTRFLDTYVKMRARLEEEYQIVLDIKKSFNHLYASLISNRLQEILSEYFLYFTHKEMIQMILNPFSYKGKIPYYDLLLHKFKAAN